VQAAGVGDGGAAAGERAYGPLAVGEMTVKEIREELRRAGLPTSGNKLDLMARLEAHLASPSVSGVTTTAEEMECGPSPRSGGAPLDGRPPGMAPGAAGQVAYRGCV